MNLLVAGPTELTLADIARLEGYAASALAAPRRVQRGAASCALRETFRTTDASMHLRTRSQAVSSMHSSEEAPPARPYE